MIEGQFNIDQGASERNLEIQDVPGYSIRTFEHAIGTVVLAGHCLSPDEEIVEVLDKAVISEDDTRITHLSGSYASIIARADRTTLFSDLAGQFPLYFTHAAGRVHYGLNLEAVAENASGMPDTLGLGLELTGAHSLLQRRTRYKDVYRLPAAHKVELAHNTSEVSRYDSLAPNPDARFEPTVEAVRMALYGAIAGRLTLHDTISSDFSGGLDSTSLAFLTLGQLGHEASLHAFHSYFKDAPSGDLTYAQQFALLDPRIALHLVELPKHTFNFDGPDSLLPPNAQLPYIKATGSAIHLDGTGADALFSMQGSYLYDMWNADGILGAGRLIPALIERARLTNSNPLEGLRKIVSKPYASHEEIVIDGARALEHGDVPTDAQLGISAHSLAALHPSLRKRIGTAMLTASDAHDLRGYADRLAVNELWAGGRAAEIKRNEAAQQGVSIHFPFLDHNVIRASLQLTGYKKHRQHQFKAVLHDALQGSVPSELLARRSKGSYSTEAFAGVRRNAQEFRDMLGHNSLLARLGIIDSGAMGRIISAVELGMPDAPLSVPPYAASIEKWLRSRYTLPAPPKRPIHKAPLTSPTPPVFPISLTDHTRAVEDQAGIALYNLKTKELRSLHHAASAIVKIMQTQGDLEEMHEAVRSTLPTEQRDHAEALCANILTTLIEQDFAQPDSTQPFSINTSSDDRHQQAAEIFYARDVQPARIVDVRDYIAMFRSLKKTRTQLDRSNLYEIVQEVHDQKSQYPWSSEQRVTKLLQAGHILGKYYVRRLACQELSLAVVVAEAHRKKRVDVATGIAADPRGVHMWPEIDGVPIRTEYDDVVTGKYTRIGSW